MPAPGTWGRAGTELQARPQWYRGGAASSWGGCVWLGSPGAVPCPAPWPGCQSGAVHLPAFASFVSRAPFEPSLIPGAGKSPPGRAPLAPWSQCVITVGDAHPTAVPVLTPCGSGSPARACEGAGSCGVGVPAVPCSCSWSLLPSGSPIPKKTPSFWGQAEPWGPCGTQPGAAPGRGSPGEARGCRGSRGREGSRADTACLGTAEQISSGH